MRYKFLRFPGGKAKTVTLSYDDGCADDKRFSDVITKSGLKCTFNLNSVAWRNTLTPNEIKEYMLDRGHEIAVHGFYHRASGGLRPIEGIKDVFECRKELEDTFGIIIRGMAYPDSGITLFANNTQYSDVKRYLSDLDIAYARTLGGDNKRFELPDDWHAWMPSAHHSNPEILEYIDAFLELDTSTNVYAPRRTPKLFYLWGHSFEFERNNNWDLLDTICEKLGGKDDIWYATNMEIYNYVNAYYSLVYSANGDIIYNPTIIDIWVDIDGKVYEIKSGETVKV